MTASKLNMFPYNRARKSTEAKNQSTYSFLQDDAIGGRVLKGDTIKGGMQKR